MTRVTQYGIHAQLSVLFVYISLSVCVCVRINGSDKHARTGGCSVSRLDACASVVLTIRYSVSFKLVIIIRLKML